MEERLGVKVNSHWIYLDKEELEYSLEERQKGYARDLQELREADLVVFADPKHYHTSGCSRHIEFGFAMGLGKRIIYLILGPEDQRGFYELAGFRELPGTVVANLMNLEYVMIQMLGKA